MTSFLPNSRELHRLLAQMLVLQDRMNKLVNLEWHKAGYNWPRAAYIEAAELMEHVGQWKWWKAPSPNLQQAKIEVVDIFHFALSWAIERLGKGDPNAPGLLRAIEHRMRLGERRLRMRDFAAPAADFMNKRIDAFVAAAARGVIDLATLVELTHGTGMSFDEVFRLYVPKNVLNVFRQHNGYRQGAYQKIWFGHEDNVTLERLVGQLDWRKEQFAEDLYARLQAEYRLAVGVAGDGPLPEPTRAAA